MSAESKTPTRRRILDQFVDEETEFSTDKTTASPVAKLIAEAERLAEIGRIDEALEIAHLAGAMTEKLRSSRRGSLGRSGAKSTAEANRDTARLLEAELWSGLEAEGKTRAELYRVIAQRLHVKPRTIRRYLSGK